ncbi:MAG: hypothetical protein L3J89_12575 [Gammaproteobacteria bacterium]|nr:hypothetical protein [Gammaproteobacteria bacterium]
MKKGTNDMFRPILILSFTLSFLIIVASPAFAIFSEFISISPATDNNHQKMKPQIKVEGELVTIRIPYQDDDKEYGKKYWLIVADKPLTKDDQDFRGMNIRVNIRSDIILMVALAPSPWSLNRRDEKNHIILYLTRELAQRAYIYHDYSGLVLDGGFYYTIDIPSYLSGMPWESQ